MTVAAKLWLKRRCGTSIVAGVDATPVLELAEHVFDPVTLAIERPVVRDRIFRLVFDGMHGAMSLAIKALRSQSAS